MEQIKKMKVVMVCHMSNPSIRAHLPLIGERFYKSMRLFLGLKGTSGPYKDFANWNSIIAEDFGKRKDIDFYIIAPHHGMLKQIVRYVEKNVHYIFIDLHYTGLMKRMIKSREVWRKKNPFARRVKKEINHINPDIVVLMGTENFYYSCTVLDIKNYPVYAMCQTVYNNPARKEYGMWNEENSKTELDLFKELKYFGVYCKMHYDLVRHHSPQSLIFKFNYPVKGSLLEPVETVKEYDFINFALTMDNRKGFPDVIQALAIVKARYPKVKLDLIGSCTEEKKKEFEDLIASLDLQDNVVFTPFFEKQSDLFVHVQKSRFAVLPCKVDDISGTMMQAMQLGLPLVVYRTTGTPSFNRQNRCALIAEKENVEELAQHMLSLMEKPALGESLRRNAREWQELKYEEGLHNGDHIIDNFKAIINHFYNGMEIPQEQLFNPDNDN